MSKEENIILSDEAQLREHLEKKIAERVKDTLNGLLDAEQTRSVGRALRAFARAV